MSDVQAPASLDTVLRERAERVAQPEAEAVEAPQAVEAAEVQEEPVEAAVEAPEAEQSAEEAPEATEAPEEARAPAVEPPHYWPADKKARFAELPADLQELVAEQERGRVAAVNRAQQEAVEAGKAAVRQVEDLSGRLASVAEQAQTHHARVVPELGMTWEQVDWPAWFEQDPQTAATFRAKYDVEREQLQRVQAAKREADALTLKAHRERENALLAAHPDFADEAERPKRIEATLRHLVEQRGIPQDRIPYLTAEEISIAHDAMRWREAQAKAQALKSAPKQPAPAAKPPVKPAAAQALPSAQRTVIDLEAKAARTGDLDDVLAARAARRRLQGQG
jgi:hypothetical protein